MRTDAHLCPLPMLITANISGVARLGAGAEHTIAPRCPWPMFVQRGFLNLSRQTECFASLQFSELADDVLQKKT